MESRSHTSRAPVENSDPSAQQAPPTTPPQDGYAEYEQPSKRQKQQSKVWDDYEKIKGPTPAENKA